MAQKLIHFDCFDHFATVLRIPHTSLSPRAAQSSKIQISCSDGHLQQSPRLDDPATQTPNQITDSSNIRVPCSDGHLHRSSSRDDPATHTPNKRLPSEMSNSEADPKIRLLHSEPTHRHTQSDPPMDENITVYTHPKGNGAAAAGHTECSHHTQFDSSSSENMTVCTHPKGTDRAHHHTQSGSFMDAESAMHTRKKGTNARVALAEHTHTTSEASALSTSEHVIAHSSLRDAKLASKQPENTHITSVKSDLSTNEHATVHASRKNEELTAKLAAKHPQSDSDSDSNSDSDSRSHPNSGSKSRSHSGSHSDSDTTQSDYREVAVHVCSRVQQYVTSHDHSRDLRGKKEAKNSKILDVKKHGNDKSVHSSNDVNNSIARLNGHDYSMNNGRTVLFNLRGSNEKKNKIREAKGKDLDLENKNKKQDLDLVDRRPWCREGAASIFYRDDRAFGFKDTWLVIFMYV
jgi:hypothetical protein